MRIKLLLLNPVLALVTVLVAFKEWLDIIHRQWLSELDLFKRRLAAYEQLKMAVAPLRGKGDVSRSGVSARPSMRFTSAAAPS